MKKNIKQIPNPSAEEINHWPAEWDKLSDYASQEKALNKLFLKTYPDNKILEDVLVKVCTLNQFYSTQIRKIFVLANHIVSLNMDEELGEANLELVEKIARGHGIRINYKSKESYLYSFATKYCSHHNPENYPIYDSYVEKMLMHFKNSNFDFRKEDLKKYPIFKDILNEFRKCYNLEKFSLKEIDKYLWQAGKEYFPKKYSKTLN